MSVDETAATPARCIDVPPTGESRASALFDYADAEGIDLAEAVAYADSASDLPMLEVVGFPVAVNPETRLAAIARKRGWLVEQWEKAPGGAGASPLPARPATADPATGAPVKALLFERKPARYAAAAVAGRIVPGTRRVGGAAAAGRRRPARAARPTAGCGCGPGSPASAAATWPRSTAGPRRYFEPIVSFPFTPGHEVVGDLDDDSRAVLVPVLTCATRGIDPVCPGAPPARINRCERIAFGHLEPGLQTRLLHRHRRRLVHRSWSPTQPAAAGARRPCPTRQAVMVEPTACAVHAGPVGRTGGGRSRSSAPAPSAC